MSVRTESRGARLEALPPPLMPASQPTERPPETIPPFPSCSPLGPSGPSNPARRARVDAAMSPVFTWPFSICFERTALRSMSRLPISFVA